MRHPHYSQHSGRRSVCVLLCCLALALSALLTSAPAFANELANPFTRPGNWYKAALHVHTSASDGDVDAPTRLAQYRNIGFDVVALTDHRKTNDITGLSDEKFLVISGMEAHPKSNTEVINHFVCLNLPQDFKHENTLSAQQFIDKVNDAGGIVIYAHPHWSGHNVEDMMAVNGYLGMEVYNAICRQMVAKGLANVHWDQVLNKGRIIPAIATDDIHKSDRIGLGWTMIKAPQLTTDAIMNALRNGSYYASAGPTIEDFSLADGVVTIKCSPVREICFTSQNNLGANITAPDEQLITTAQWKVHKISRYVRAYVTDPNGNSAWTNPITIPKATGKTP